jgi:hypothetical protein
MVLITETNIAFIRLNLNRLFDRLNHLNSTLFGRFQPIKNFLINGSIGSAKPCGVFAIRHLTASILYPKGYSVSVIQAILRHKNSNTAAGYLRTLGLEQTREALEEGLKGKRF